jgi:rhamnosyltransferase
MNPLPDKAPARADVCAVLVTYHPAGDFASRLERIVPQVGRSVIIDNGSGARSTAMLRELAARPAVALLANQENLGIARALNMGVQHALAHGCSWAVLLDQDTEVDANLVATLLATRAAFPDAERVAVVGSRFRDTHGRPAESLPTGTRGEHWQAVESVITSGSLLSLQVYAAIGPFRDEFFIDYVDTEYCFRARAAGFSVIETRQALMSHTVGAPTQHRLLGKSKWTTNHSADRRYYIARNNTVLLREYGAPHGGSWKWKSLVRCFRLCKRIAFFERDKIAKILAVGQGWRDAMRGTMGPRGKPYGRSVKPPQ